MIILKLFSADNFNKFKNNILSNTNALNKSFYNPSGIYSKFNKHSIKILDVERDTSLRGENFNIAFNGVIIHLHSKKLLLGFIGPSLIYTLLTILIILSPLEYLTFRIVALVVWFIIYFTNYKRTLYIKQLLLRAFSN